MTKREELRGPSSRPRLIKPQTLEDGTANAKGQSAGAVERIRCDECGTVVAERREDGWLIIRARHRGLVHVMTIPPARRAPMSERNKPGKIRCAEIDCMAIVAERRAGGAIIIIRARHHDETHVTIIEPWPPTQMQDLAADAV
jgi:hypothetical protein